MCVARPQLGVDGEQDKHSDEPSPEIMEEDDNGLPRANCCVLVNSDTPATTTEVEETLLAKAAPATTSSPSGGDGVGHIPCENNDADTPQEKEEESMNEYIKRTCIWCARANDPILEYLVRSPGIWLHALQYTIRRPCTNDEDDDEDGVNHDHDNNNNDRDAIVPRFKEVSFRTSLPEWAKFQAAKGDSKPETITTRT